MDRQKRDNFAFYRRSRSDLDGPPGTYIVFTGKGKSLVDCELAAQMSSEAVALAEEPAAVVRNSVASMLDDDHCRRGARPHIAGLLRCERPYDPSAERVKPEMEVPEACDCCSRSLGEIGYFVDACTVENMQWAYLCPPCFFGIGCGVGNGFGQLYRIDGEVVVLIHGGP